MGIGGIGLVHELMEGFDVLVVVDAVDRGGEPGSLYVLEVEVPQTAGLSDGERYELSTDLHQAVPSRSLILAEAAGVLPPIVRMIGCQPGETDEFCTELSPEVQQAVRQAVEVIVEMAAHDDDCSFVPSPFAFPAAE
jgi:hydrogenase maturation protease